MTGGRGFIAIALVIFSRWHPLRAIAGALLFSGAVAVQLVLQSSGVCVALLLDTIPYIHDAGRFDRSGAATASNLLRPVLGGFMKVKNETSFI